MNASLLKVLAVFVVPDDRPAVRTLVLVQLKFIPAFRAAEQDDPDRFISEWDIKDFANVSPPTSAAMRGRLPHRLLGRA